jgi:hypothetical protein
MHESYPDVRLFRSLSRGFSFMVASTAAMASGVPTRWPDQVEVSLLQNYAFHELLSPFVHLL